MKIFLCLFAFFVLYLPVATAQQDSTDTAKFRSVFSRLEKEMKSFSPDTSNVPKDRITSMIIEIRQLKGVFNINEAIEYKLQESKQKKEISDTEYEAASAFFAQGRGRQLLDNAVVWIYRKQFTSAELKELLRFYKTSAGKKMAEHFPLILLQSAAAAEMIKGVYGKATSVPVK